MSLPLRGLVSAVAVASLSGLAGASTYVSTFNVTGATFTLSYDIERGATPLVFSVTDIEGTLSLDIPPAGTSITGATFGGTLAMNFVGPGPSDFILLLPPIPIGEAFVSAGVETIISDGVETFPLPALDVDGTLIGGGSDLVLTAAWDFDPDGGTFGENAFLDVTISGTEDALIALNTILDVNDNDDTGEYAGTVGASSFEATLLPAPGASAMLALAGLLARRRRRA